MSNEIVIKVDDKEFSGWTSLEITQGLDYITSSFGMTYTNVNPETDDESIFIMGKACKVEVNGHRLITGYIEEIDSSYDESSHTIQVRGRDKTADLVDCSYWKSGYKNQWLDQSVESLIKKLCDPFDITVVIDDTVTSTVRQNVSKRIKDFKTKEGDTVIDAIMRIAKNFAILPISYGDGKLTLTRAATNRTAATQLETSKNILSAHMSATNIERFSNYIVKGHGKGGDDIDELGTFVQPTGSSSDVLINRHRPLVILADEITDSGKCKDRAKWEAMIRAGKSRQYEYVVVGWLQENGEPWPLNASIKVKDYIHNNQGEFLTSKVIFRLSDGGDQTTSLTLVDKKTYELIEQADKIKNEKYDIKDLVE